MAKKTPPRTKREIKAALSASKASSVEVANSNCNKSDTLEAIMDYNTFGFGKTGQTYVVGSVHDFASNSDQAKQTTGKKPDGSQANIKDASDLISRSLSNGLATNTAGHFYFSSTGTGVTGSVSPQCFVYGQSGPQAAYIPQLVHGSQGLEATQEYVFHLPSSITGAAGANMPVNHSRSFEVTIAGAVAPGESVQVYTASAAGVREATGSAFTFSSSFCTTPNFTHQTMHIPTSSLDGLGGGGITIIYTASYTAEDNKENTPYAGLMVNISPSAIEGS